MKTSNITIMFNGQTEAAFSFYKSIFGGEYTLLQRMKDIPGEHQMLPEEMEKILYISLKIGSGTLMGMDVPSSRPQVIAGNNFFITLDTSNEDETTAIYKALSVNGNVMMPLGHQFWGAFFGMVTDKFGIQWMISYEKSKE